MIQCKKIDNINLNPASSKESFLLHLAATELSLFDPIIINKPEDIQAKNWKECGLKPFEHQIQNLITFCKRLPITLIADEVGLGKTISALIILSELMSRNKVKRTLVIAPKILLPQWQAELKNKFGLDSSLGDGSKNFESVRDTSNPVILTTYRTATKILDTLSENDFDFCILDEAHKLRNLYGTNKAPALAKAIQKALKNRLFKYVLMLTATPIQNRIWDLYSLIDLLKTAEGKVNPLGNIAEFQNGFLEDSQGIKLKERSVNEFHDILRGILLRTRRNNARLPFPTRKVELVSVTLDQIECNVIEAVGRIYQTEQITALNQISLGQALMSSPQALKKQIDNMKKNGTLSSFAFSDIDEQLQKIKVPGKMRKLFEFLNDLRQKSDSSNWRVVVFTMRTETLKMIGDILLENGFAVGFIQGGEAKKNQKTIDDYCKTPPGINVIISTDAGSEGINLQAGNILINYDLPWNPMIVEQRIGRIQRLGSQFESISVMNLAGKNTIEYRIVGRLMEKLQGISQSTGDLESILESADYESESETNSIENKIRELIVNSFRGIDIEKNQQKIEKNIENANRLYNEQKENLDKYFGYSDTFNTDDDLLLPEIKRKEPSMSPRDFVLGAFHLGKTTDGEGELWTETKLSNNEYNFISKKTGERRYVKLSDTGNLQEKIYLYLPGQTVFERLIQHWSDHYSFYVLSEVTVKERVEQYIRNWWNLQFPNVYLSNLNNILDTNTFFHGSLYIKTTVENGVDRLESVLSVPFHPEHSQKSLCSISGLQNVGQVSYKKVSSVIPSINENLSEKDSLDKGNLQELTITKKEDKPCSIINLCPDFENAEKSVNEDINIRNFCGFYEKRLQKGLNETGNNSQLESKIRRDFMPFIRAVVCGAEGKVYKGCTVELIFIVDQHSYQIQVFFIPFLKKFFLLEKGVCEKTGITVPKVVLEKCASSGKMVLKHLLITYHDGRRVLPEECFDCELCGKKILKSEAVSSAVSQKTGHESHFIRCQQTGDFILTEESDVSDFSQKRVRYDILL